MTRRTWPIWLLRDWPALVGLMLSFWPLMILAIASGRKAMAGKTISQSGLDLLMALLPRAEARLRFTLAREAARRLGMNPRDVQLEDLPSPESWDAFVPRFNDYAHAVMDMDKAAVTFTEALRRCFGMSATTVRGPHASTDAAHCAAAQHELAGLAGSDRALILSSARSARPSKDERGLAHARGPPRTPAIGNTHPGSPRFRERARMPALASRLDCP